MYLNQGNLIIDISLSSQLDHQLLIVSASFGNSFIIIPTYLNEFKIEKIIDITSNTIITFSIFSFFICYPSVLKCVYKKGA